MTRDRDLVDRFGADPPLRTFARNRERQRYSLAFPFEVIEQFAYEVRSQGRERFISFVLGEVAGCSRVMAWATQRVFLQLGRATPGRPEIDQELIRFASIMLAAARNGVLAQFDSWEHPELETWTNASDRTHVLTVTGLAFVPDLVVGSPPDASAPALAKAKKEPEPKPLVRDDAPRRLRVRKREGPE